jgi:hypothetical protein
MTAYHLQHDGDVGAVKFTNVTHLQFSSLLTNWHHKKRFYTKLNSVSNLRQRGLWYGHLSTCVTFAQTPYTHPLLRSLV